VKVSANDNDNFVAVGVA